MAFGSRAESGGGTVRKSRRVKPAPVPSRPTPLAPPARPVGVFASPVPAQQSMQRAQQQAARRTQRARQRVESRVSVPYVPKISGATQAQRAAAQQLAVSGLAGQGIHTRAQVNALPAEQRRRANRLLGYGRTLRRNQAAAVAIAHGVTLQQAGSVQALADIGHAIYEQRNGPVRVPVRQKAMVGVGPASINLAPVELAMSRFLANHTSLSGGDLGPREFVHNAFSDLGTLGAAPFVGAVEGGHAAVDLAQGHPRRAEALARGIGEGLLHSAPVQLATGHPGRAAEAFREHPVLTGLDFAGAASVAGRTAGALARGIGSTTARGGFREALGRAGSTVRPPLAMSGDRGAVGAIVEREYSKDLTRKAAQVAADARREPLRDRNGDVVTVEQRGRRVPVLKASPREREKFARQRADFVASRANSVERLVRDQAGRAVVIRGVRGKAAQQLVAMAIEGTVTSGRHLVEDLRAHRDRLNAEYERRIADRGYRHSEEARANRDRVAMVEKILASPRALAQGDRAVQIAETLARRLNEGEARAIDAGLLHPNRARRARLIPAAIEHLGARHFTVEQHRRLERAAQRKENETRAAFQSAKTREERAAAMNALTQARQERIAVSGRDPAAVDAHDTARLHAANAKRRYQEAQDEVAKLERARHRLSGVQSVQRGAEAARRMQAGAGASSRSGAVLRYIDQALGDERRLKDGARKEQQRARVRAKVEQRLSAARARAAAAKARWQELERDAKSKPMPPIRAGVRTAEGKHLPNDAIEAFLRQRGRDPESISYLPHRNDVRGHRAFHTQFRPGSRPAVDGMTRTGEAYRKGATEISAQLVHEHGVRQATQLAKAEQLDRLVHDHGLRHPAVHKFEAGEKLTKAEARIVRHGGYFTAREAKELADRILADTGERLVPVRAYGSRVSQETQRMIRGEQNPGALETLDARLLNDRIVKPGELDARARNVVLMPAALVDRLERHVRPAGALQRFFQVLNQPFRMAVLPQPRWLAGQFIEPFGVRLAVAGSGVTNLPGLAMDVAAARKVLRHMESSSDPKMRAAAQEIRSQQLGGLLIGRRGATVRRRAAEVGGPLGNSLALATIVRDLPAVKQLGDLATLPLRAFFGANRLVEGVAQHAALGKQLRRDVQQFEQSWTATVRLGKSATAEAARGLVNTATQQRFMKAQHDLLGQYEGFSPAVREAVMSVAPFLPWALASARFVFWTMPVHHTATTALLIKSSQVFGREWKAAHEDAPPGDLQQALRTRDGGLVDIARYTPFGLSVPIVSGDLQGVTDQFLPQVSGTVAALEGRDPFGRDLKVQPTVDNPQGKPSGAQKLEVAGNSLLEALVPYLATARRLQEHGGTGYADSTALHPKVKPGSSHMSAVRRTFDPFRPTYLRQPASSSSGGLDLKGFDAIDRHDIEQAMREAQGAGLDAVDRRDIQDAMRQARRGGLDAVDRRDIEDAIRAAGG